jgi:hypothetical protein
VQSGGRSSTGELLTYFYYIFTLVSVVTFTICFFLKEKYKEEVIKNTAKTSTTRRSPLMVGSSMITEAEKHMDGEIDALFSLTLLMRDTIPLTTIDYFFGKFTLFDGVLDSREAVPPRQSSLSTSFGLTPHVSQIHLNYEAMENDLSTMKDVLAVE